MIPREIQKKIQQIELRTNRLASRTRHGSLLEPVAKFGRVLASMPDSDNYDLRGFQLNGKIYRVWPTQDFGFSCSAAGARKPLRLLTNRFENIADFAGEFLAKSWLAPVVKINRLDKFLFSLFFDDRPKCHRPVRNFLSMSAITSSNGRHRSGCAKARSARRSSSAAGSGVSSSLTNSSRICSKTARCSSAESLRNCSTTSVALMPGDYRNPQRRQSSHWSQVKPSHSAPS
jgi:hypothetical protein